MSVPSCRALPTQLPPEQGRPYLSARAYRLQALAEGTVQEGHELRVYARVQPQEDARVLVLCKIRILQQWSVKGQWWNVGYELMVSG